ANATVRPPDLRKAWIAARSSCTVPNSIGWPPILTIRARTRSSPRARLSPDRMSVRRGRRIDMTAESGSVGGPSTTPSVRSSSRISGAVRAFRNRSMASVIALVASIDPTIRDGSDAWRRRFGPAPLRRIRALRGPQPDHPERRDAQPGRVRQAVPGHVDRLHPAEVAHAAARVLVGVGVEDLLPDARLRQPEVVVLVRDAGEVRHAGEHRAVAAV